MKIRNDRLDYREGVVARLQTSRSVATDRRSAHRPRAFSTRARAAFAARPEPRLAPRAVGRCLFVAAAAIVLAVVLVQPLRELGRDPTTSTAPDASTYSTRLRSRARARKRAAAEERIESSQRRSSRSRRGAGR